MAEAPHLTSPSGGGGGGAGVSSFNTRTGAVTLAKADVTATGLAAADVAADASGAASAAQAASLQKTSNLSDVASAATARGNLGAMSAASDLSAIATANPATAAVSLNSKKIISLANGTLATDAAAFGQIPTTLPPNGSAGGDLSGTYPNPGVAQIQGKAVDAPTTKGDLYVYNGTALKRIGVGSDTQVLTADSTQTLGVKWAASSGGSGTTGPIPRTVDLALTTSVNGIPNGANWAVFGRVMDGARTITKIGFVVTTQSGNMSVAVFRDNGSAAPGTLAASSASTAVPAAGIGYITIASTAVAPGDWIALACDNTTARFASTPQPAAQPSWRWVASNLGSLTFASNPTVVIDAFRLFALWGE